MVSSPTGPGVPVDPWVTLPIPGGDSHDWTKAYRQFQATNNAAGYLAWLQANKPAQLAAFQHGAGVGNSLTGGGVPLKPGFGIGPGLTPPGSTTLAYDDPSVLGLYNRSPNWLANFVTPGTSFGGPPQGAQGPAGPPMPTPPPAVPPGTGSGSGTGVGGNEGGAAHAGEGANQGGGGSNTQGSAGGNAGGAANNQGDAGRASGANAPSGANMGPGYHDTGTDSAGFAKGGTIPKPDNRDFNESGNRFVNLGPWGSNALAAGATLAPGYTGLGLSALQAALRGYNTFQANSMRPQGMDLSPEQWAGSLGGFNNYGGLGGNNTIRNPEEGVNGTAVTTGGMYDRGLWNTGFAGPLGVFSNPRTAYTPTEAAARTNALSPQNPVSANPRVMAATPGGLPAGWSVVNNKETNFAPTLMGPGGQAVPVGDMNPSQLANIAQGGGVNAQGGPQSFQGVRGSGYSPNAGAQTANGPLGAYGNALGAGGSNQMGGQMATGGPIPGNALQGDTVPIRATPGEFMLNHDSAKGLGPQALHMLNNPEVARWIGHEMGKFSRDPQPEPKPMPQRAAPAPDPHLHEDFLAAIAHPQHAAKLAALIQRGWAKSWA